MVDRPDAPGPWVISSYTNTRVNGKADDNQVSFTPILQWQLAWSTKPGEALWTGDLNPDGSGFVSGLNPGVTYYFWNRLRNEAGWSDLSARTSIRMKSRPDAPPPPSMISKDQDRVSLITRPNLEWHGASPVTSYELSYSLIPAFPDAGDIITHGPQSIFHLFDLNPGFTYHFWSRTSNIYGTSEWS
ncbi:MAG TPA: hypothetical protein VFP47_03515, partial [Pyrinomonadaceae bacterium]|nr:hypothetical protein [Pyrinomonadaceae bacterium]